MKKFFTKMSLVVAFVLGVTAMNAQQLWPTADSATIKASQFADTTQVFWSKTGGAAIPVNFTGWVTKGLTTTSGVADNARWVWRRDASANGARYDGGLATIVSPSSANGAAVFNSDLLDSLGTVAPHSGEIVSPKMNTVGYSGVSIQFNQYHRNLNTQTLLSYSSDDGVTWSTGININSDIAGNANTPNTSVKKIRLPSSVVGSANFRIKFTFTGRLYFWIVDDVKVLKEPESFDLQMTSFYAIPSSLYTPKEQVEPIYFMADIKNAGTLPMKNIKLSVNVWRAADGAKVFTSTSTQYDAITRADTVIENRILPASLNPATLNAGKYFGSYRVSGDSSAVDVLPLNDTVRFTFVVSDTTAALSVAIAGVGQSNYTKEDANLFTVGNATSYWPTAGEAKTWRIGNFYRLNKGKGKYVSSIIGRFNPKLLAGGVALGALYEWNDANANSLIEPTERNLVAYAEVPVAANVLDQNAWFLFKLLDLNTSKPFQAKDSTSYLAMIEMDPLASNTIYPTAVFSDAYNYNPSSATWSVRDSLDKPLPYTIIIGKSGTTNWTVGGYSGVGYVPCIRMNVTAIPTDIKTILSDDNKLVIYPNPSNGTNFITADVDLVEQSEAIVNIMTLDGKYITEQVVDNLKKTQLQIDVSDYAAGMYLLKITTAKGIMTKRFVVTK